MLKFIRGKGTHISAERVKVQKELFAFSKTVTHGFPSKPTALAYDPQLGLLAIANKNGALIVVGQPGVEYSGQHPHDEDISVTKICFVPKLARIITLCDDNSLHLWRFQSSTLQLVKSYPLDGKLKRISSIVVKEDCKQAYIGTEGGNIYMLDINKFEITDKIIYLDVVLQNGPENYKVNPGAVECILELPQESQVLIGYERGLVVLWDAKEQKNIRNFVSTQQLEDICWYPSEEDEDEKLFATAHNDGSYIVWDIEVGQKPKKDATTPYGPFPCKRIGKLRFWKDNDEEVMCAFSGGMPRRDYGDHFTVTVKAEGSSDSPHVTFDLTSKAIDFVLVPSFEDHDSIDGSPAALIILAEEELIAVDLQTENWPLFYPHPYLNAIHPSAVTCFHHVGNVSDQAYAALKSIGLSGEFSKDPWPIKGGKLNPEKNIPKKNAEKGKASGKSLLITGHEDGSIRFWDSTGTCLTLLTKFSSSALFSSSDELPNSTLDTSNSRDDDEEEWPPFRKVGTFDPYSDDPRLAVKKISFCPKSGVLVLGGTAGQLVIVSSVKRGILPDEPSKLDVISCNMVADKDGFVWKGHDPLEYKPKNNPNIGNRDGEDSFTITALLQIKPPAAVTALALEAPNGVIAVGTAHGVLLFDFFRKKVVMVKSTLNPNDVMAAGDTPISRRKSIKKSLRESFRRLRKGRSQRAPSGSSPIKSPSLSTVQSPGGDPPSKPVERAIEARGADDAMSSMVRSVTFAKTYIISLQTTTPTLWAGTNAGTVYAFTVGVPGGERRSKEDVSCQIAKEIQLKHRAPVLSVIVLDCNAGVVDGFSPQHDHLGPHKVIISSEEQIKIFTLPALRPFGKLKLTAQEGSRTRKIAVQDFVSTADEAYHEKCLSCITNQGDVFIITVPDLRKQIVFSQCIKREDITGISSFTFNESGEAFYQISSSQLQRVSVSTRAALQIRPKCSVVGPPNTTENESSGAQTGNHVDAHNDVGGSSEANHREASVDDVSSEVADITIDSVRDHTITHGTPTPTTTSSGNANSTTVEERLIDGGSLLSPVSVTNQIRSVTTVTTTTVVNSNSVQNPTVETSSASSTSGGSSSTTTVVRAPAPLADADDSRSESPIVTS
ncbi:unnamed protein product [Orchesella dallaii]|uniref:Lethal giant larvae homologue 2 domain-containing protein n=1 Tax=Orchesella dallaii TaxID=48710 RepID=A0ABP1RAS4_9HEXA